MEETLRRRLESKYLNYLLRLYPKAKVGGFKHMSFNRVSAEVATPYECVEIVALYLPDGEFKLMTIETVWEVK